MLHIPSTLNIDLILWHTQLIVCAENVKSWFKSWVFLFTSQAYILGQRYTHRVLQTIQMKLILLFVWAELAVLGSAKTILKFKYEI